MKKSAFFPALASIFSAVLFFSPNPLLSQDASQTLNFSNLKPNGSAGFLGPLGTIGSDFPSSSFNPAGVSLFNKNEFSGNLGATKVQTSTMFNGDETWEDDLQTFRLGSVGLVLRGKSPKGGKFNAGFGVNQVNNYNHAIFVTGNASGTVMNGFFKEAQQIFSNGGNEEDLNPFGAGLVFKADGFYGDPISYDFATNPNVSVFRTHLVNIRGSLNEAVLSLAGTNGSLALGFTMGVPFGHYTLESVYSESDPNNLTEYFDSLTYFDNYSIDAVGINCKIGLIYKAGDNFRTGFAIHTPTSYRMKMSYENWFNYGYTDINGPHFSETQFSPLGVYEYNLKTPWRLIGSLGFVDERGFINVDVEWVDHSANRYSFEGERIYERGVNAEIRNYQSTLDARVNGEIEMDIFRFRGGFGLSSKPQKGSRDFNQSFAFGVGLDTGPFFLNFGFKRTEGSGFVQAYRDGPKGMIERTSDDYSLGFGFRF